MFARLVLGGGWKRTVLLNRLSNRLYLTSNISQLPFWPKISWKLERDGYIIWDKQAPQLKFGQKWKHQSCSNLHEMVRKFVEHDFLTLKNRGKQNLVKNETKSRLFHIVWNGEKHRQTLFLDFMDPLYWLFVNLEDLVSCESYVALSAYN